MDQNSFFKFIWRANGLLIFFHSPINNGPSAVSDI